MAPIPANPSPPLAHPPYRFRPQFSLRLLFLAFTAFAIGFPLWYYWPIREIELEYPRVPKRIGAKIQSVEDKSASPISRTLTTWRRDWKKGKVKSGPKVFTYLGEPRQEVTSHYANDQRHGLFTRTWAGQERERGQYVRDQREGEWITRVPQRGYEATAQWHKNQLHGLVEIRGPDGKITSLSFKHNKLTQLDGQPVRSPLFDRIERGEIDSPYLLEQLNRDFSLYLSKPWTLNERYGWLLEENYVPLLISPKVIDRNLPIPGCDLLGINYQAGIVILAQRLGLDCDYRFGAVWITTPADAANWRDPTGVSDLRLQPGTLLSAAWNSPAKFWEAHEPLSAAITRLSKPFNIPIDITQVAPTPEDPARFPIRMYLNINGNYLTFRNLLGILLLQTGCRCQLSGDQLVILPP